MEYKIIPSDCIEFMRNMKKDSVNMILTDIPYDEVNRDSNGLRNLDKLDADVSTFELDTFVKLCIEVCSGSIYIFCGIEQVSLIRKIMVDNGLSTRLCVWEKTNPSPMNGKSIWLSSIECCVFGKKKGATFKEHCKGSVWRFSTQKSKVHPTQKPIKLFKYLIEVSSNEGDIILDPCAGSGTTLQACVELKRSCIAVDISIKYCNIMQDRLANAVNNNRELFM